MEVRRSVCRAGQFFVSSRVSLVCNVCSRLLPKEWFAKRPMASARANSRVPTPRHLCIIMLRSRPPSYHPTRHSSFIPTPYPLRPRFCCTGLLAHQRGGEPTRRVRVTEQRQRKASRKCHEKRITEVRERERDPSEWGYFYL